MTHFWEVQGSPYQTYSPDVAKHSVFLEYLEQVIFLHRFKITHRLNKIIMIFINRVSPHGHVCDLTVLSVANQ